MSFKILFINIILKYHSFILITNYQLIIIIIIISLINYKLLIFFKHHSKLFETVSINVVEVCNVATPTKIKTSKKLWFPLGIDSTAL